ncbi:MAG: YmdB family metallophosphoesterase [Treponema sp.]|nr:YmdB family metallophosphoesterase [Treponema sp.]
MIIIMLGDVVGEPGLMILEKRLPELIKEYKADFTVVNGENAAAGFGLTPETLDRILEAGADVVTSGNHIWEKREIWPVLESSALPNGKPLLRPANYPVVEEIDAAKPNAVPGRGWMLLSKNDLSVLVMNLQGRELMTPIDCPFQCFDTVAAEHSNVPVIIDFHAESAEEKEALAYYLDGRAGIVAGTHTHVQTADERLLPQGTAYISDLGMTGATNGVIGMDKDICINRTRSQIARRMECADAKEQDCAIQGIVAELDEKGKALNIRRINR